MNYRIVRLTSDDYKKFQKAYSKIVYSFREKGKYGDIWAEKISSQIATATSLRTKAEFLKDVKEREMYFFQIDGEIQGYMELIFAEKNCEICEFSVFEHSKGWGSILFDEAMNIIKGKGCTRIKLWCPFPGAQVFWKKMGFTPFYKNQQMYFQKKVR